MEIIGWKSASASGLKRYFTGNPCNRGHVSERFVSGRSCVECAQENRGNNKEAIREKDRARYQWEKDARKARANARAPETRERRNAYSKAWKLRNKAQMNQSIYAYVKRRKASDPVFALSRGVQSLIANAFRLRGFGKKTRTATILGCTWPEFAAHIERQFLPGMSWDNRPLWHLDHIVPLATAVTEADVLALNHFTNLRPLWGPDNLKKGAKQTHLL